MDIKIENIMHKVLVLICLCFFTINACAQSKLTQKQIEKRKYQEIIGDLSNSEDTLSIDSYAMYPKGVNGFRTHVLRNLKYPYNAYKQKIQGTVILRFVVEKDGTIEEIEVIQSVDPELDKEAIRVLKKLELWVPGYKSGVPVRVEYKFPFNFKL